MGRDGLRRRDNIWHIDTTIRGRRIRQSCETEDREEALAILRQRVAELDRHGSVALRAPKVSFEQMAEGLVQDYQVNKRRSLGKVQKSIERLGKFFGGWRAVSIGVADVRAFIEKRQRAGLANGSINRELSALKRMFYLAVKAKLLSHDDVPSIEMLQEAPPRAGFFEPEQFQAVLRHLPPYVQPIAIFAFQTGWRLREVITLQWRNIDLERGSVQLDAISSKNRQGRNIYISADLLQVLRAQAQATRTLERRRGIIMPWVFHRNGKPIGSFYKAWRLACKKAGVPGMIFHDLRRTAVRNMVRAGVPERVAMLISGHKTRSVFERYNIVCEGDLKEAARRLGSFHGSVPILTFWTNPSEKAGN